MTGSRPVTPRVLILGWGFLGGAIGEQLLADGMTVTGLTRSQTWRTEAARTCRCAHPCRGRASGRGARQRLARRRSCRVLDRGSHARRCRSASIRGSVGDVAASDRGSRGASRASARDFTYMSSGGAVYGNPVRLPVRETDAARPISPDGASHLAAEGYAQMSARRSGSRLQIVRCSNVYGPHQPHGRDQGVVAIFLDRISKGDPLRIFGDGSALLDYVSSAMSPMP